MEYIQKYFTELDAHFNNIGRRVRIRVYSPGFHGLGGQPYTIEMASEVKGRFVDIRIESSKVREYTFQVLDADREGRKLVLGVRRMGKVVKTYFFGRNNGGGPDTIPGCTRIVDYESAPVSVSSGNKPVITTRRNLHEKVTGSFEAIGLNCYDGYHFSVANDDSVSLNFGRISGILDIDQSKRQILLKGNAEANYLCGMDERHPFVALIPIDTYTIKGAHSELLPDNIEIGDDYKRQGEWFFIQKKVPGNFENRSVLKGYELKRMKRSKPHMAEIAVKTGNQIFVKGWIEHENHTPLFLDGWHLVRLNKEMTEKYTYNPD